MNAQTAFWRQQDNPGTTVVRLSPQRMEEAGQTAVGFDIPDTVYAITCPLCGALVLDTTLHETSGIHPEPPRPGTARNRTKIW